MRQDDELKARLGQLRQDMTPAERLLWRELRAKRFDGTKISRQVPIGPFIADFVVRSAKLVVEIDGDSHGEQLGYDARRTAHLERLGYRVIRFTNSDLMHNLEGVLQPLAVLLSEGASPLPSPLPAGERERT